MGHSALLVVDVQIDFCPGGALPVPDGDRVVPTLSTMGRQFMDVGLPVFASRDWHPPDTTHFQTRGGPWPVHCVARTPGAQFHPELWLPPDTIVISKGQGRADDGYSAFEGTTTDGRRFAEHLRDRGVTHLYVGGLATDYCVRASVLDARSTGLVVTVLGHGIAGITEETTRRALDEMRSAGATVVATLPGGGTR
jgi:nicotinamidase/pyrazinamidase